MNYIKDLFLKIKRDWESGNKPLLISKFTGILLCLILFVTLLSWLLSVFVNYVILNFDWIVTVCLIVGTITVCLKTKVFDKNTTPQTTTNLIEQEKAAQMVETNYCFIRQALFDVVSTLYQVIKVKKPLELKELESINHSIRKGNIILYEYMLYKTGNVTTDMVRSAIEREIEMNLKRQSFVGMGQAYYFYQGQPIPIIQIDSVEDRSTHYLLYMVVTDENYCRSKRQSLNINLLQAAESIRNPTDRDF